MVGLTECETVVENFFDFHFSFLLATVMVGYMYEEAEKDDVVVGREREKARERESEGERGTTLLASAEWK